MKKKGFLLLLIPVLSGIFYFALTLHSTNQILINLSLNYLEPSTEINIQGRKFHCLLDLGCGPELILKKEQIQNLVKQKNGQTNIIDLNGHSYFTNIFRIQDVLIGKMQFHDVEILEDHNDFHFCAQFGSISDELKMENARKRIDRFDGKLGRKLLQSYDCFIDFPNLTLNLFEGGNGKKWCNPNKFVAIPFLLDPVGIIIPVEVDSKIYRMVLDTGSNYSIIKQTLTDQLPLKKLKSGDLYFQGQNLILGGLQYGSWEFGIFDMLDDWKIDGCLGADFFLEYRVYIDFQNQMVYIQRPERFFISTQWKRLKHRLIQFSRKTLNHGI